MGVYTVGAATLDGTLVLLLPVHDVRVILLNEQVVPNLDTCDADTRGLLTSATCHVLLRTNPSGVLSPPGPLNSFPFLVLSVCLIPILGNMLLGITFSTAPESTTTVTFFHVH